VENGYQLTAKTMNPGKILIASLLASMEPKCSAGVEISISYPGAGSSPPEIE